MRKIIVIFMLTFFLVALHLFLEAKENPIRRAELCLDWMNYKDAIQLYSQAIAEKPQQPNIRVSQAYAYFQLGKLEDATKKLKEELTLFPDNFNAYILLGYVYFNQGKQEEASEVCQEFNTLLEKAIRELAKEKGLKLSQRKDKKEFLENYEFFLNKIRKKNPNFGLPNFILGLYHKKNENFEEARENFHSALQRGYDKVGCYMQLIDIELQQKNWQGGLKKLKEATEAEGSKSEFYFLKGYAYYHLGEIENAVSCFENVVKLKPYLIEAIKNSAKIYFIQKKFKQASPLLEKILRIVPLDYEAKFLLERILKERPIKRTENMPQLTKNIVEQVELKYTYTFKTDINNVINIMNESALTLVRSGKLKEAIILIHRFLEINDQSPELNYNLAHFYSIQNEPAEALKYAVRATELKKDFKDAHDLTGSILFKLEDFESSLRAYGMVVSIDPEDAMGYYNLGCAYSAIKDFDKAEESWKNAISHEKVKKIEEKEKVSKDELTISVTVLKRTVSYRAYKALGDLYLQQDHKDKALQQFERAVALEPRNPELYIEIGKIYLHKKNTKKAIYYFEQYLYLGGKEEKKVKEILKSIKKKKDKSGLIIYLPTLSDY